MGPALIFTKKVFGSCVARYVHQYEPKKAKGTGAWEIHSVKGREVLT